MYSFKFQKIYFFVGKILVIDGNDFDGVCGYEIIDLNNSKTNCDVNLPIFQKDTTPHTSLGRFPIALYF